MNGELGGRVIRSLVLLFGARARASESERVPYRRQPMVLPQLTTFSTTKLSCQMTPANKLVGFWLHTKRNASRARASSSVSREQAEAPVDAMVVAAGQGSGFCRCRLGTGLDQPRIGFTDEVATPGLGQSGLTENANTTARGS